MIRRSDCKYDVTAQHDYRYKAVIKTTTIYWHRKFYCCWRVLRPSTCSLFDGKSIASYKTTYPRSGI